MLSHQSNLSRRAFLQGSGTMLACRSRIDGPGADARCGKPPPSRARGWPACTCRTGPPMDKWTPATEGHRFTFTEILNRSSRIGTAQRGQRLAIRTWPRPAAPGRIGGANHNRPAAGFLTGAVPERGAHAHLGCRWIMSRPGTSARTRRFPSLELSIEEAVSRLRARSCCAYRNSISWKSPTDPLPMQNNPRWCSRSCSATGPRSLTAPAAGVRSLLDSVSARCNDLQRPAAGDRRRLWPVSRRRARSGATHPASERRCARI